jgi:hypothetical protein
LFDGGLKPEGGGPPVAVAIAIAVVVAVTIAVVSAIVSSIAAVVAFTITAVTIVASAGVRSTALLARSTIRSFGGPLAVFAFLAKFRNQAVEDVDGVVLRKRRAKRSEIVLERVVSLDVSFLIRLREGEEHRLRKLVRRGTGELRTKQPSIEVRQDGRPTAKGSVGSHQHRFFCVSEPTDDGVADVFDAGHLFHKERDTKEEVVYELLFVPPSLMAFMPFSSRTFVQIVVVVMPRAIRGNKRK